MSDLETNPIDEQPTSSNLDDVEPDETPEEVDDLATVAPERLAQMVRAARKEAADNRAKLREVEASRDALSGATESLQRDVFRNIANELRLRAEAVVDLDALPLDDVLDENGTLDHELATAKIQELSTSRPHWFHPVTASRPGGLSSHTGDDAYVTDVTWSGILKK